MDWEPFEPDPHEELVIPKVAMCPECADWMGYNPFCETCERYKDKVSLMGLMEVNA